MDRPNWCWTRSLFMAWKSMERVRTDESSHESAHIWKIGSLGSFLFLFFVFHLKCDFFFWWQNMVRDDSKESNWKKVVKMPSSARGSKMYFFVFCCVRNLCICAGGIKEEVVNIFRE
ncbi:hypothetical protein TNIN_57961 [Trichonephila inaurata madagascariensis]|uniref:Uncharacterized protein n=1 Tax=Trichonephila inaurata madagascariensis TaxID=2747483 RepID=A0A8X6X747_9ARAC|nr:hypothetical protein TNIN_57961 [Trichonephila inaurata madagascariensis]